MENCHNQKKATVNHADELNALHFITHELKNTVLGIIGIVKMLMRTEQDPDRKEKLKIIYDQTKQLEEMSTRFLLSAQLEHGQIEIQPETIENLYEEVIYPVISALSKDSDSPFFESQKEMENRNPIKVTADKNLLRIVFQNLLGNALTYRYPGGEVSFSATELEDKYQFIVWNAGPGVAEDETERVFDKFYRADDSATQDTKGSGLGLYNTQQIVEAHNGELWCETKPGKWISFFFTLPISASNIANMSKRERNNS